MTYCPNRGAFVSHGIASITYPAMVLPQTAPATPARDTAMRQPPGYGVNGNPVRLPPFKKGSGILAANRRAQATGRSESASLNSASSPASPLNPKGGYSALAPKEVCP